MRTMSISVTLGLLVAFVFVAPPARAAQPAGFVAAVRGDARIVRGGEQLTARVGLEVRAGDRLVTGEKARLKVLLTDDAVVALGSGSEVVLTSHMFGSHGNEQTRRRTRIELVGGTLRALVQKLVGGQQADFEVKSANAVAGVRGTEFVLVAGRARTRLVTLSGAVQLADEAGGHVLVAAGEGSLVEQGTTEAPTAVAAAELRRLRAATDTDQNPTALAWNLRLHESDRLGATGRLPRSDTGAGGMDQELGKSGPQQPDCIDCGPDPRIEPCRNCWEDLGEGNSEAGGSFSSGDLPVDAGYGNPVERPGNWIDDEIDLDPAGMAPVTLHIHVHRP